MSFLENESSELNASTPKELLDASLALDNADIKQGKAIFLAMAKAVRADPPGEDFVEILAKRIPTLADYGVRNEAIDVLFALAAGPDAASAEKAMRIVRSAITDSESGYLT
ncbi:MAG: hypothetical protein PHE27_01600, partial [Alphaproteobacteria bacterium]|nr:hypothetical protein [Alphaproteobacteria bacterium]